MPCCTVLPHCTDHTLTPFPLQDTPGYHEAIRQPMDLGTIAAKAADEQYGSPEEFAAHVRLVVQNSKAFNPPTHWVHQLADNLWDWVNKKNSFFSRVGAGWWLADWAEIPCTSRWPVPAPAVVYAWQGWVGLARRGWTEWCIGGRGARHPAVPAALKTKTNPGCWPCQAADAPHLLVLQPHPQRVPPAACRLFQPPVADGRRVAAAAGGGAAAPGWARAALRDVRPLLGSAADGALMGVRGQAGPPDSWARVFNQPCGPLHPVTLFPLGNKCHTNCLCHRGTAHAASPTANYEGSTGSAPKGPGVSGRRGESRAWHNSHARAEIKARRCNKHTQRESSLALQQPPGTGGLCQERPTRKAKHWS